MGLIDNIRKIFSKTELDDSTLFSLNMSFERLDKDFKNIDSSPLDSKTKDFIKKEYKNLKQIKEALIKSKGLYDPKFISNRICDVSMYLDNMIKLPDEAKRWQYVFQQPTT